MGTLIVAKNSLIKLQLAELNPFLTLSSNIFPGTALSDCKNQVREALGKPFFEDSKEISNCWMGELISFVNTTAGFKELSRLNSATLAFTTVVIVF